ncbi:hypothetical protein N7466_003332 [Penicillium verhagenii]|uniref:uncharacterized protein n=1 Tax=Penicillium verhagenii TaxID=1562060 RepID=UPI0025455BE5|nr:uncharacterized protein N7466_003332 [Penicillium verhagenii]KAJ5936882.1 hypothetical protein N7466_003332 [Penicillium verhagenii]
MYPPTHIIDPDGEVIIVLRNAGSPFARPPEKKSTQKPAVEVEESTADSLARSYIRIQASAKHLIFASPVFKKLLTGGWKESVDYLKMGSVEITADDWDTEAFLIVLRAVHGQYHDVPRMLSLEMLAKVAVILDYYQCKKALDLINEIWIKDLEDKEKITPEISRDLILWLWIAWFFERPAKFNESTLIAISKSGVLLDNLGLPIPTSVIDSINNRRNYLIQNLIDIVYATRDAFLHRSKGCGLVCRSIMYGNLALQMQSTSLPLSKPRAPFRTVNYSDLVKKVLAFKSPQWYHTCNDLLPHRCKDASFAPSFAGIKDLSKGLNLQDFIS